MVYDNQMTHHISRREGRSAERTKWRCRFWYLLPGFDVDRTTLFTRVLTFTWSDFMYEVTAHTFLIVFERSAASVHRICVVYAGRLLERRMCSSVTDNDTNGGIL